MGKKGPCCHCGVTSTPLWRNGPLEKPILCNACGSRWRTKGSLVNYTPLHSRVDPDEYEDRRIMRMKSISLKKKDEKLTKRKLDYEHREFTPDNSHVYQKNIDEDTSNRSSSGSAISNSDSCAQFCSVDGSEFSGPSQSVVWDTLIPSRKRTCVTRVKQSSVEKLTKDLCTILHNQASQFSGSSEEELLYESDAPMVSVEIGHGSVLIRHPSSMAREEESEASSLSVDNKLCRVDKRYSASLLSLNDSRSVNNSLSRVEEYKSINGQIMQFGQLQRDNYDHEKFQVLCNNNSPLSSIDLAEIANFDVFHRYLTDEEQQGLLKYLPSVDTSADLDSLESLFTSSHIKENLSSLQQLLAEGVLDTSFSGVKTEDCKVLKRLALSNSLKCKWVEHYNLLKHKGAEENSGNNICESGAKSCFAGTPLSVERFRETHNSIGAEAKGAIKSPKRVALKVDYKRKGPLQNEASYVTQTPRNIFAMPTKGSSFMLDSMHCEDETSDQDLLVDLPSNGSFPQAELLCPASSFVSHQASASSSSIRPSNIRA